MLEKFLSRAQYPQSVFWIKSKKNSYNVYPYKPQFYYIKVGFRVVVIAWICFPGGKDKSQHSILYLLTMEMTLDVN